MLAKIRRQTEVLDWNGSARQGIELVGIIEMCEGIAPLVRTEGTVEVDGVEWSACDAPLCMTKLPRQTSTRGRMPLGTFEVPSCLRM